MNVACLPVVSPLERICELINELVSFEAKMVENKENLDHLYEMGQLSVKFHEPNQEENLAKALRLRAELMRKRASYDAEMHYLVGLLLD